MLLSENNPLLGGNSNPTLYRAASHHPAADYFSHSSTPLSVLFPTYDQINCTYYSSTPTSIKSTPWLLLKREIKTR